MTTWWLKINAYANFAGINKAFFGQCESGELYTYYKSELRIKKPTHLLFLNSFADNILTQYMSFIPTLILFSVEVDGKSWKHYRFGSC